MESEILNCTVTPSVKVKYGQSANWMHSMYSQQPFEIANCSLISTCLLDMLIL